MKPPFFDSIFSSIVILLFLIMSLFRLNMNLFLSYIVLWLLILCIISPNYGFYSINYPFHKNTFQKSSYTYLLQNKYVYGSQRSLDMALSEKDTKLQSTTATKMIVTVSILFTSFSTNVWAKDGEYGLLEGKWAGMLHPIYFLALFGVSISAAYQGLQYRRARELTQEINRIKTNEFAPQLYEMRTERDKILATDPKGKHISLGSIILGSGTAMALEGGLSTYLRVGELFPDYHLFAGLGLVSIWAASYSLAPFMSKGYNWARNIHIALNSIGILLFITQIVSGWEIMINVFNEVPGW